MVRAILRLYGMRCGYGGGRGAAAVAAAVGAAASSATVVAALAPLRVGTGRRRGRSGSQVQCVRSCGDRGEVD